MALKHVADGKSAMQFEINFSGLITVELRGKVLVEIIKSLIYQSGQTPLPYDQIKRYVETELAKPRLLGANNEVFQDGGEEVSGKIEEISTSSKESNIPRDFKFESNFRKIRQAYETLTTLFEHVNVVLGNELFDAREVLLFTGATQVSPRELYHLILPDLKQSVCSEHDDIPKLTFKACMVRVFREIVTNNIFWESSSECGNVSSIQNIFIMVKMSRQATMSDHMEPQINFQIPTKAYKTVTMPIKLICPICEVIANETKDINEISKAMNKVSISGDEEAGDQIWVKILPVAKGFSNSLLGNAKK